MRPNHRLERGLFDLVIIDEASQCSLATALPLVYRAKRLAVIGDPELVRDIDLKLSGAFQEEGFVVVAVGGGDKAALAREMRGLSRIRRLIFMCFMIQPRSSAPRACGASHRRTPAA